MRRDEIKFDKKKFKVNPRSYRAMFDYEEMTGKSISKIETLKDNITFLYCMLFAVNEDFEYTFDEFIKILEDNPETMAQLQEKLVGKK